MQQILRGKMRRRTVPTALAAFKTRNCFVFLGEKSYHTRNKFLLRRENNYLEQRRGVVTLVGRLLRGALKIRYLVLGGTVGGGMALQKGYQDWKDSLPDMSWLEDYMPSSERIDSIKGSMIDFKDKVKDIELDPRLKTIGEEKWNNLRSWLDTRIAEAYEAAEKSEAPNVADEMTVKALPFRKEEDKYSLYENPQQRIDNLQKELMDIQLKYQKELERLEKENKELKKQILLTRHNRNVGKTIKKSLIDMYSELLDELSEYDSSYDTQDHLPRVVVVGDQSAGKTSVLEMIAQARIFPRGAGEMMTRAPVKVTLSEGPYHIAQFKDSDREFDLTKEDDLAKLRTEVELRMKRSLRRGKTVSSEVISMTVKGPGLQRMVLVDLPGIISTVTSEMAHDTKELIRKMSETHMSNPNAIILCVQDGSVDAERSNVTDLVSTVDPGGKRTIFVLTKVDLAEEAMTNPERIKKILSGKLFPMKALGYFAVVTGRGKKDDTIQDIKEYEEKYFRTSRLFRENTMSSGQVTTRNLSLAVAQCFWKMVRETVEQQADAFKATRFNLEAEWKNSFPWTRELDRDELFERARGEILDEVVNLSQVSAKQWEVLLLTKIWDKIQDHVFENIYLPAAQTGNPNSFNTRVDIRLREWAQSVLAGTSISAGEEALRQEFSQFLERSNKKCDPLFLPVKISVLEEALQRHSWETKGLEMLRAIQLIALEDRSVRDKQQWDSAIKFLEKSIKDKLEGTEKDLRTMLGPSTKEKWLYWKYSTEEENRRNAVKSELEKILYCDYKHGPTLSADEMTAVRKNVSRMSNQNEVGTEIIEETWSAIYRRHFLKASLARAYDCRKAYYLYHQGLEAEVECSDVVLFWRLEQMLKVTSNALRQQVMNREARRLDKIIKEVLEDYGQNSDKKLDLLTGRRVTLAEELKRVRRIQDRLEEFIQALNLEK